MDLLFKHSFPPDAWLKMKPGISSPDSRVVVDKVIALVDRCSLVFTFPSTLSIEGVVENGRLDIDPEGDFFVGVEPTIKRVTIDRSRDDSRDGSLVAVEFIVSTGSAVYQASTKTLFVCHSAS
jgi:hypothetical protein